jgi:hypothetical protein
MASTAARAGDDSGERVMTRTAREIAAKYVWWKDPDAALANRTHFLCTLMTYGTLDDTRWMLEHYSPDDLRAALLDAPPGVFNARSWVFWHHKLGIAPIGDLPTRTLPD